MLLQQEQQQQQEDLLQATLHLLHAKERDLHTIQNDIAALRRIVEVLSPEAVRRAPEANSDRIPDPVPAPNSVPDPEGNRGGPRRRHLGRRERRRLRQQLQQRVQQWPKHVVRLIKTDTKTVVI